MSLELYANIDNVTLTATGETISLNDSANKGFKGLRIFGKTVQNGTPSPDAPVPLESVGDDGNVTVNVGTSQTDENPQTATFDTPNGLPGIPVASGGNYTDSNGQMWLCDEIDANRGVYVQRVGNAVLDSADGWSASEVSTNSQWAGGQYGYTYSNLIRTIMRVQDNADVGAIKCNLFETNSNQNVWKHIVGIAVDKSGTIRIYWDGESVTDTLDALFKATPMHLLYALATPIETPLSAEELAQYSKLRTKNPNTTVYNDSGAGMVVKYAGSKVHSNRYEITHAISIQMTTHYNDIGKLQLVVPASDYNITALKTGSILFDTVRGTTYIIVNTKCDTTENRITANGFTTDWLLNKRSVAVKRNVTTIESGVYDIINENLRDLSRISTASVKGLAETFSGESADEAVAFGGQLLDEIIPFLDNGELGHRMVWDAQNLAWTFEIFKGEDLTSGIHAVAFAEEQGTCSDLVINEDSSLFKNFAYVKYHLADDTEPVAEVGSAEGDDRFEKWIDLSVSQEQGESAEDCRKRAVAYATMELGKLINRKSFKVTIDASELGTRYNIGDVVSCVSIRFGVSFHARITGVKYRMDATGEKTEIILGDPILTALGALKLNG